MFDETLEDHIRSGLFHLEFAREMLLRTGSVRAFERHDWAWVDEAYTGMPEADHVEGNLNTLFQMTEPRLRADVLALHYLNESREEWWRAVVHPDGRRAENARELRLREEDFGFALIVSSADVSLLERYRQGLARRDPVLRFFAHDPEPPPPRTWRGPTPGASPEPTPPNFMLLIDPWSGDPMTTMYNIARRLVGVWESERESGRSRRSEATAATRRSRTTFVRQTTFGR